MYKKFTARWYLQSSISDVIFVYLVCKCAAHVLGLACKSCLRLVLCDIAAYHLNSLFFTIAEDNMIYDLNAVLYHFHCTYPAKIFRLTSCAVFFWSYPFWLALSMVKMTAVKSNRNLISAPKSKFY